MKVALDLERLTTDEKLELIEKIWESLAKKNEQLPLSAAHRQELNRRIDQAEADGWQGITWEQLVERIRTKR